MNSGFAFRTGDYADPEAVEAAIRGRGMAFTVTEAGSYRSRLMHADVGGVWMQAADVSLPEIVEGNGPPGRIVLGFETIYGNSVRVNGLAPSADEAVLGSPWPGRELDDRRGSERGLSLGLPGGAG